MKVGQLLKKINGTKADAESVRLIDTTGVIESRFATSWDFRDYYYDEKEKTIVDLVPKNGLLYVYYK